MRRIVACIFVAACAIAAAATSAHAAKRVALVVGNSAYKHTTPLLNPRNDAVDVAATLRWLGFETVEGLDLSRVEFEGKIREFSALLADADVGVFFYAGHGLQVSGQNYLVPVDAKAETADAADWEMLRLDLVQRTMERAAVTNILFIDACRDNPLARNLASKMGTRSTEVSRGLAAVEGGVGTLVSFSTHPGAVAYDGSGRNSPYTTALVRHLAASEEDLGAVLIAVRNDVMQETQRKQVPWEHSALTGRFFFHLDKGPAEQLPPPAKPEMSEAERDWLLARDSKDVKVLEAFAARHKGTFFAELALARIRELKQSRAATQPQTCSTRPVGVRVFTKEPPRGVGALGDGEKAYVNDGECGPGFIKEIVGGGKGSGSGRKVRCVPCT